MRTTTKRTLFAGTAGLVLAAAALLPAPAARADGELTVSGAGAEEVANASYPDLVATISVVDPASGRPVAGLESSGFVVSDETGRLPVASVTSVLSEQTPVAFTILLDTGGAMAPYLARARELLQEVVDKLGPNDVVRIVKFNDGTDEQGTNWVRRDDVNLAAQVASWQTTDRLSLVVPALVRSSEVARQAPQGYQRHAIVAFLSVAGARGEPGMTLDTIGNQIPTVTFAFGFGMPPADQERLPFFLEDLAKTRGGAYWPVDSDKYRGDEPTRLRESMHALWTVEFRADGLPDNQSHQFKMEVRDNLLRTGILTESYTSGGLLDVSPLKISGLRQSDKVKGDRKVAVSVGGKQWPDWKVELYRDCQPGTCAPAAETRNGQLDWRLLAGPLEQGQHVVYVRLTAGDGKQQFSDTQVFRFTRAGTGWNLWTPMAVLGLALIATVIVVAAARRRSSISRTDFGAAGTAFQS